jgi:hypothetical protein
LKGGWYSTVNVVYTYIRPVPLSLPNHDMSAI